MTVVHDCALRAAMGSGPLEVAPHLKEDTL